MPDTNRDLLQRGLRLEYATLVWNVVGSLIVLAAALRADSIALEGFGLDSLIEIIASLVVVWQLKGGSLARERLALKLIGGSFLLLAAYILAQTVWVVASGVRATPSLLGMVWLLATFAVMLLLAGGKLRTGRLLGNAVLMTEARVTVIDAALAASVLVGVALNTLLGWWWADPLAGLLIVYYAIKEGLAALTT